MPTGALILALPLALGGESGGDSTGIAVLSVVSIVAGYLLIAALWYFVFRDRARARRRRRRGPSD
jgi:peptidoglycan/LPS O-acetylase OafA/YrhL